MSASTTSQPRTARPQPVGTTLTRSTPARTPSVRTASARTTSARPTRSRSASRRRSVTRLPVTRAALTPATADAHVRLTRRGRVLVLLALVGVLVAAFSLGRSASQAAPRVESSTPSSSPAPAAEQLTVQRGDSLWTVAERVAPRHDPRDVVAQIRRLNDLRSAELRPGQQLLLPVAG